MPAARAEILINAPIDHVWSVMMDVHRYDEWNPFVEKIGCAVATPTLGTDLRLHVHFKNGMKRQEIERITQLAPPADGKATLEYMFTGALHNWNMVRGKRQQTLQAQGDKTLYVSYENLTGWLSWAAPIKQVKDGFGRHAAALKLRCETEI